MKNPKLLVWVLSSCIMFLFSGCGIYSFTGSSTLSDEVKTFSIQNIVLAAPATSPTISQVFTEKLKEYYQRNTKLKQVGNDGDVQLEGAIVDYRSDGVASAAGDKAAMNRLTVVVEITFVNKFKESDSFDKEFSFYLDYPQNQPQNEAEVTLVPKILDQLVLNIFSDTVAKW